MAVILTLSISPLVCPKAWHAVLQNDMWLHISQKTRAAWWSCIPRWAVWATPTESYSSIAQFQELAEEAERVRRLSLIWYTEWSIF